MGCGPKHKVLRKEFLQALLKTLSDHRGQSSQDESRKLGRVLSWTCWKLKDADFYEPFLQSNPVIDYEDERFRIQRAVFTDARIFEFKERTYKDAFCFDSTPRPSSCTCEDSDDGPETLDSPNCVDETVTKDFKLLSLDSVLQMDIHGDGEYFSQPNNAIGIAGAQYGFEMCFYYWQPGLNIFLELTPVEPILERVICGHTGNRQDTKLMRVQRTYSYKPNLLYFEDDSLHIVKRALLRGEDTFDYRGRTFKIVDTFFCSVWNDDFPCGCTNIGCDRRPDAEGISGLPLRQYYTGDIHVSCTPEWFIQYQVSCCVSFGYCSRIILELLKDDAKMTEAELPEPMAYEERYASAPRWDLKPDRRSRVRTSQQS